MIWVLRGLRSETMFGMDSGLPFALIATLEDRPLADTRVRDRTTVMKAHSRLTFVISILRIICSAVELHKLRRVHLICRKSP